MNESRKIPGKSSLLPPHKMFWKINFRYESKFQLLHSHSVRVQSSKSNRSQMSNSIKVACVCLSISIQPAAFNIYSTDLLFGRQNNFKAWYE